MKATVATVLFLAAVAMKISRYLAPQVYSRIFSGQPETAHHF